MDITPPQGSKIYVDRDSFDPTVVVPQRAAGVFRFFIAAFLVFWLGGWTMGFLSASGQVFSGKGGPFLIFWLAAWTVGGLFVLYMLFRLLRPNIPERITLGAEGMSYDSGAAPFRLFFGWGYQYQKEYWRQMFPRRRRLEFSKDDLKTLTLRETPDSNRLTLDRASERIDIAVGATEVEREWLFSLLRDAYS